MLVNHKSDSFKGNNRDSFGTFLYIRVEIVANKQKIFLKYKSTRLFYYRYFLTHFSMHTQIYTKLSFKLSPWSITFLERENRA